VQALGERLVSGAGEGEVVLKGAVRSGRSAERDLPQNRNANDVKKIVGAFFLLGSEGALPNVHFSRGCGIFFSAGTH